MITASLRFKLGLKIKCSVDDTYSIKSTLALFHRPWHHFISKAFEQSHSKARKMKSTNCGRYNDSLTTAEISQATYELPVLPGAALLCPAAHMSEKQAAERSMKTLVP
jgi:hypothetical protein